MGVCIINHSFCIEFIMWQRLALAMTVVLLGFSGGVFALFCSWHARWTGRGSRFLLRFCAGICTGLDGCL